jgi:hypothetical protein
MITTQQLKWKMITQSANVIIFVLSFFLVPSECYHLCYNLMLSFFNRKNDNTVRKCYNFCVIIFPCTCWVLSFMLSFYVVSFLWNFFVSREAATAERKYKKERWSENYVHMAAFSTRTCLLLPLSFPPPLFSLPPANAITTAAGLHSHFRPPHTPPKRIMDRSWQPRHKLRMASI